MGEPVIESFVLRIFHDSAEAADRPLRVTVRHVQSGDERHFTQLEDAFAFLRTVVAEPQSR